MKILISGVSGLLGNNLAWHFQDKLEVVGLYRQHTLERPGIRTINVDLRDYGFTREIITTENPDVVIHCASRTDVDGIEKDREGGWQANVLTTRVLLDSLRDSTAKLIYISTDSVYPGLRGPYSEIDPTGPLNWYGATKIEGEDLVAARSGTLILRTNIFGWNVQDKVSLGEWFLSRLRNGEQINGFVDARFSSIYTFAFAAIIEQCLQKNVSGIYNCASRDSCSKFEFGRRLAELFGYDKELVKPAKLVDMGFKAHRGHDLSLNTSLLSTALGASLPTIQESLEQFHANWKMGVPGQIKKNLPKKKQANTISYPIRNIIPYGGQFIDELDIEAVTNTLKSPYLVQGPAIDVFERNLAQTVNSVHCVAVNSGTSALHIACLACGITQGDEVITSPITFVASANCAVFCGARPVFADIDPLTYNISAEEVDRKITAQTKAVIPVHFAGQSCDMVAIADIVRKAEKKFHRKIYIIEDASHALGSKYQDTEVGSCAFSDMAIMSFHPVKHITTGEGGAVLTKDDTINKLLRRFRSHGITSVPEEFIYKDQAYHIPDIKCQDDLNPWYYEQQGLGYNYRITDIQCSLGISQLKKIAAFRNARRQIVDTYNTSFADMENIQTPHETASCYTNFHLYVLLLDFEKIGTMRAVFMRRLKDRGVQTQVHYIPVHTQPFYQEKFGTSWGDCPNAEAYYSKCLSIPLYPGLTREDVEKVVRTVKEYVRSAR